MKFKGFIHTPRSITHNNANYVEGNPILVIDIDLEELSCPSKIKKLGSNSSSVIIKRKYLVRSNAQCSMHCKYRAIYVFST